MIEINLMENIMQDVITEFKESDIFTDSKGEFVVGYHYNNDNHYIIWMEYRDKECGHEICARGSEGRFNGPLTHEKLLEGVIKTANTLKDAVDKGVYTLKGLDLLIEESQTNEK